jgi:hypothetical protein
MSANIARGVTVVLTAGCTLERLKEHCLISAGTPTTFLQVSPDGSRFDPRETGNRAAD